MSFRTSKQEQQWTLAHCTICGEYSTVISSACK